MKFIKKKQKIRQRWNKKNLKVKSNWERKTEDNLTEQNTFANSQIGDITD